MTARHGGGQNKRNDKTKDEQIQQMVATRVDAGEVMERRGAQDEHENSMCVQKGSSFSKTSMNF